MATARRMSIAIGYLLGFRPMNSQSTPSPANRHASVNPTTKTARTMNSGLLICLLRDEGQGRLDGFDETALLSLAERR